MSHATTFRPGNTHRAILNDPDIDRAVALRRAGRPVEDIARELDVSPRALYRLFAGESYGGRGKVEKPSKCVPGPGAITPGRFLFLDIDGVLNTHRRNPEARCGEIHRDKVGRLNRVLRETGCRFVLSSAWRYLVHREEMNLAGLDWLLRSHGVMAGRLAGITRPDSMRANPNYDGTPASWPQVPDDDERGLQIREWIVAEASKELVGPLPRWVVLDDLDLGISKAGHPFIHVDGRRGLQDLDADRAIAILRGDLAEGPGRKQAS